MCDGEFQSELAKIDKRRLTPMLGQSAVKQPDKLKMVSPLIMNRYGFIGVKTNVNNALAINARNTQPCHSMSVYLVLGKRQEHRVI
jgi:hypothetical protein